MFRADRQAVAVKVWREMQQVFMRHLSAMEKHGVDAEAMIEAAQSMLLARAKTPGAAPPPPWSPLWMAMTLFTTNPAEDQDQNWADGVEDDDDWSTPE